MKGAVQHGGPFSNFLEKIFTFCYNTTFSSLISPLRRRMENREYCPVCFIFKKIYETDGAY